MFNDLQGFKRESHKRHKSDRRLDNNLYKFHKKSRNEKIKKLKKLDKHAKLKLEAKVEAKIEEDHEKDKIKKEHIKSEKNGINVEAALTKILPHFMRKFPKALKMLNSLFRLKSQEIDLDLALGILFQLYCNMDMLETSDDWKYFHNCFLSVENKLKDLKNRVEEFSQADPETAITENKKLTESLQREETFFGVIRLLGLDYLALRNSDDSFDFNQRLKTIENQFTAFRSSILDEGVYFFKDTSEVKLEAGEQTQMEGEEQEDTSEASKTKNSGIIHDYKSRYYEVSGNLDKLMNLKRESFLKLVSYLLQEIRLKKWAEPPVANFIKKLFHMKDMIYNEDQQEAFAKIMEKLYDHKNKSIINGQQLQFRDGKILENPLNSYHEVKDNREWTFSMNGLDKWTYKQLGL